MSSSLIRASRPGSRMLAVAWQECRLILRQRLTLILFGLLLVSLLAALLNGWHHHRQQIEQQAALQAVVDQQWLEQPDRHPHRVAHFGTFAFRSPSVLGFFEPGVDRYVGNSQFLEAHRQNPANFAAASQASSVSRLGDISPASVLQVLLPLLLLVLAGMSVSREREQHTLVPLLAQGLAMHQLVLGKALAYTLLGAVLVLITLLVSLPLVLLVEGGLQLSSLLALAWLALTYLLYAAFWALLAVSISALCSDSRQALLLLAGIWVLSVVVSPRVLPYWLQVDAASESRLAFNAAVDTELRAVGDSHNSADQRFAAFEKQILEQYGVQRVEDLPVNFGGLRMQEGERRTSEVFAKHYDAMQTRWDQQARRMSLLAIVNPVLAVQQASAALAATDRAAFRHFEAQSEAYRYDFVQQLNHIHTHEISYQNDRDQRVSQAHWQAIALFQHHPESLAERLTRVAIPLGILVGWCLLLLLGWRYWLGRQA
ncbi:MAG: DUF3526 domain-containing protein [Pseudomonas sp.]